MAYRQSNPFSRRISSPFNRNQAPRQGAIGKMKAISRRPSSPLSYWPTAGTKAGSIEEAYELAPLKPGQQYVDLNPDAAPGEVRFDAVEDLNRLHGGLDVEGDTSTLLGRNSIQPRAGSGNLTNIQGYGLTNQSSDNFGDYIRHPFGWMNTGYGQQDDGSFNFSETGSQVFGRNNRAFPVRSSGYTTEADLTSDFDENMMYTDTPTFNPYTQRQSNTWDVDNILTNSAARGGRGARVKWNTPTGFSPEGINTPWHHKKGPKEIYENVLSEDFNIGDSPTIGLGDFRNQWHDGRFTYSPQIEQGKTSDNAAINKVEIPNALSLYSNIDPNSMFTSNPRSSTGGVQYSDQFKRDYPSWLAGGLQLDQGPTWRAGGSRPDFYDPSTNMFGEGAYTSSRFAPHVVGGRRTGGIAVDNPMTVAGEMVRDPNSGWDMKDFMNYSDLIKRNYGRGNVAGQKPPRQ